MSPKTKIQCPDCKDFVVYECLVGKPKSKAYYCPECGDFVGIKKEICG